MNKALLSSKNMCWCTPQDFFDKLNQEFQFVLDPAATDKTAKCPLYYTPETDGLSQSWDRGGAVFCNPPYGREIGKWVKKAFIEARGGFPIVLLIPARTDTNYFHDYIYGKAEIRFVRGRLHFTDDDGNAVNAAPFPSMVVIYNGAGEGGRVMDIEKLIEKLCAELDVMREITEFPAADVVPVKHGKWGTYEVFPLTASLNGHPCSECGMRFSTSQIVFMNYCPNCGARMEQEEEA